VGADRADGGGVAVRGPTYCVSALGPMSGGIKSQPEAQTRIRYSAEAKHSAVEVVGVLLHDG